MKNKQKQHLTEIINEDAKEGLYENIGRYFPIVIKSKDYPMLLAVQTMPVTAYYFKDKEVSVEELINILENLNK